jgi:hypothetical protein
MREPRDTERGERVRACRSHGRLWRNEGRSAASSWRIPAPAAAPSAERAERIAMLRVAVETGTYAPDPRLVAAAILLARAV